MRADGSFSLTAIKTKNLRSLLVKTFALIFVISLSTACRPYRVCEMHSEIPFSNYSNIDDSINVIKSIYELPRRMRMTQEIKFQTNIDGAYDKKSKFGYLYQHHASGQNQCTVFYLQGDCVKLNVYFVPDSVNKWTELKTHLTMDNMKLFGGGIKK